MGILMVSVMIFWVINTKFSFYLSLDCSCLGLHDEHMRCEVIPIQNYGYALVSGHIFLLNIHAVGGGTNCFVFFRDLLPFSPHTTTAANLSRGSHSSHILSEDSFFCQLLSTNPMQDN